MQIQFLNRKLLRYPAVIIAHIVLVTLLFNRVYPEVEIASLSTVIAGTGLCLAFITDYLFSKFKKKKKEKDEEHSAQ